MLSRLSSFSGPLSKLFTAIKGFTLNGLILRYEISDRDSYSGTNTVTDLVSNSNATLTNGPTYSINGYLNFDGVNDYVYTNSDLQSSFSGVSPNKSELTSIFMWIYPTDDGVILSEIGGQNTFAGVWHTSIIEMVSGTLKFGLWSVAGIQSISSSVSTPFNSWYYVGMVYNGSTLFAYVDDVLVGSLTFNRLAPYNSSSDLYYSIAHSDTTNMGDGSYTKMKLGAFHVYNTALSQQQVLSNYNYTKSNYIHTGSMSIWIDANDPASYISGTSVGDLSGNGYTHSLTSGATLSTVYGFKSFDCATGLKRIEVNGTGPTLPTIGYTYVVWARLGVTSSYRTLLYTNISGDKYTPITIPSGTNTLGWWDINTTQFISSGHGLTSSVDVWVQYAVVGDSSSQTYYVNDTQVGNTIPYGIGTTTHWGLGNNATSGQPFGHVGNMMLYNKKLTLEEIKQNYDALKNVYKNGDFVINNLILNYNPASYLSYPSAGTTISNLVSNSLNGVMSNITFTNPYLTFNGSNSQVTITDNALLEPGTGDWTIEVWANQAVSTGSQVILGKFDTGGASQDVSYAVRVIGGKARVDFGNGSTAVSTSDFTMALNTWYQLTYVFTNVANNNIITYVNGVSQSTATHGFTSILNTSANLYLGSYNNGEYSQWFDGKIGIVRIYNSALSASDVSKNFEANRNLYGI